VPKIYAADADKQRIPTAYFIMEKLPGKPMNRMDFSKEEKRAAAAEMARMAAQLHSIKNDRFGYIQNGLHDDWHQAIRAMTQALIHDCTRKGKRSPRGERLLVYIEKYKDILRKADCSMVNFDIWAPNILCKRENGKIHYAWIDPERSFWGDRIADFVCLEMLKPLAKKTISIAAYNADSDQKVLVTDGEKIRYAIAQGYLGLIMETEKYYRYSPCHFGWWRNVAVCKWLFQSAFTVLEDSCLKA
jgi:aminoglycoside phosphotransferase (APT) family kinase protein